MATKNIGKWFLIVIFICSLFVSALAKEQLAHDPFGLGLPSRDKDTYCNQLTPTYIAGVETYQVTDMNDMFNVLLCYLTPRGLDYIAAFLLVFVLVWLAVSKVKVFEDNKVGIALISIAGGFATSFYVWMADIAFINIISPYFLIMVFVMMALLFISVLKAFKEGEVTLPGMGALVGVGMMIVGAGLLSLGAVYAGYGGILLFIGIIVLAIFGIWAIKGKMSEWKSGKSGTGTVSGGATGTGGSRGGKGKGTTPTKKTNQRATLLANLNKYLAKDARKLDKDSKDIIHSVEGITKNPKAKTVSKEIKTIEKSIEQLGGHTRFMASVLNGIAAVLRSYKAGKQNVQPSVMPTLDRYLLSYIKELKHTITAMSELTKLKGKVDAANANTIKEHLLKFYTYSKQVFDAMKKIQATVMELFTAKLIDTGAFSAAESEIKTLESEIAIIGKDIGAVVSGVSPASSTSSGGIAGAPPTPGTGT